MDVCAENSYDNFPWQATLEGILSNLKGEIQIATSKNAFGCQPVSKPLTTEALFMLNVILIFIILTVIGSLVGAIEFFCKEFGKEISFLLVSEKVKATNSATYTDDKRKAFKPSTLTIGKPQDVNIYHIKEILKDGLLLTLKAVSKNGAWKNCKKYLHCFSVQRNVRKLLTTESGEEHLNSLHGMKALSLIWVLGTHVCMFYATILRVVSDEFQYILELPITQILLNGIFANDVFFVLSGFMTGYVFFDYYKKNNGKISWLLFYISRFLRFTPLYLLILGFYTTMFSYIGSGPVWPTYTTNPLCRENWIWNVLYLNNFLPHKKQCMLTTWYIACDLQLYIISPLFLLLLMRRPKIGLALTVACIFGTCFISIMLTKHFELIDGVSKLALHSRNMPSFYGRFWIYFDIIYVKPYTRIGSYLIGISLGYFIFQRKLSEGKKNSMVTLSIGWIVCIIFWIISFFAIFNRDESIWERAVYNGVKHVLCSCGISWAVYVCVTGQGGFINQLLSLKLFVPLSRLSYSFYFIHIIAIEKYFLSLHDLTDFNFLSAVFLYIRILLWTFSVSFVVSLIFERPLLNMLVLLLRKDKLEKNVQ